MSRPTSRVLALLELLQTGGVHTVAALAGRLGVDERTVRRYVDHLDDLGVPVEGIRGRHGGYRLAPGYRMPPLMLTDAEAVAAVVGMAAGRRAGVVTEAAESATAKIRRVVPAALRDRLDALLGNLALTGAAHAGEGPAADVLLTVARAAREHHPLRIAYAGRGDRTLHPYGLVVHAGRWYVAGADSASGEVRTFRLDRVERAHAEPGRFLVPESFDAVDHVLTGLAQVPYLHAVEVHVRADAEAVRARLPPGLAVVERRPDGGSRVTLRAQRLDWVPALLASLDTPFVVVAPDALREHVRGLARRLDDACR